MGGRGQRARRVTARRIAVGVAAVVMALPASGASAATRPDLAVTRLTAPLGVSQGGPAVVADAVRGRGSRSAGGVVRYVLRDGPRGRAIVLGRRRIPPLAAGRTSSGRLRMRVPLRTPPGRYALVACVQVRGHGGRTPRCRSARRRVEVIPAFRPRPLDIEVGGDAARAASATITPEGGALEVVGADGTVFRLRFPAGAVGSRELVTMTPAASVRGLPFRRGFAGVLLEPEGLRLFTHAVLEVVPPRRVPVAGRAALLFTARGRDAHLAPVGRDGRAIEIAVGHFSGAGLIRASEVEFDRQGRRIPSRREAWAQQEVARRIREQRQAGPGGDEGAAGRGSAAAGVHLYVWANEGIRPLAAAAAQDDVRFEAAVHEFFSWLHLRGLVGADDPRLDELGEAIAADLRVAAQAAIVRSERRCAAGDLTQVVRLLRIARLAEAGDALFAGTPAERLADAIARCARFELDFGFRYGVDVGGGTGYGAQGEVRSLRIPLAAPVLQGSGPLEYVAYATRGVSCPHTTRVQVGGPVTVTSLELDLGRLPPRYLLLRFDPGTATEELTIHCPLVPPTVLTTVNYRAAFNVLHEDLRDAGGLLLGRWDELGGTPYARTTLVRTRVLGPLAYEGISTWVLRHLPRQGR